MTARPAIVRPREDRPNPFLLSATATLSLVSGLVIAYAVMRQGPAPEARASEGASPAARAREELDASGDEPSSGGAAQGATSAAKDGAVASEAPSGASGRAEAAQAVSSASAPEPSSAEAAPSGLDAAEDAPGNRARHRVRVTPGRVAYLRCDGAPERTGPFPCPRDRALEERAFGAILGLPTCTELAATHPPPIGRADAWLVFHGPALGGVRMRESPGSDATAEVIRACLEARLTDIRSRVQSDRMTVSFRFDLR